jgi:hypothetical protein
MNEGTNAGDDENHHRGKWIEREVEIELDRPDANHLPRVAIEITSLVRQRDELRDVEDGEAKSAEHRADRDRRDTKGADVELLREIFADGARLQRATEERIDHGAEQRQKRNEPENRGELDVLDGS